MQYLEHIVGNTRIWNVPWNVINFETTYKIAHLEPIEIAIVPVIGGKVDEVRAYSTLLRPSRPIPKWIEGELPITNEMLEDAPEIDHIRREVRRKILSGVFVHHSKGERGFDVRFASEFFSVNADRLYIFSTIKLSQLITPNARVGHALYALCRRYRVTNREPHRARSDAVATAKILIKMLKVLQDRGFTTFSRFERFYAGGFNE